MQDDIKMIKRFLAMEDTKRMKFAIDPTEGKPKDYDNKDDEIEKNLADGIAVDQQHFEYDKEIRPVF